MTTGDYVRAIIGDKNDARIFLESLKTSLGWQRLIGSERTGREKRRSAKDLLFVWRRVRHEGQLPLALNVALVCCHNFLPVPAMQLLR